MTTEPTPETKKAWLPPRWFIRIFWFGHRAAYRLTGGRRGLKIPTEKAWGMLRLRSTGRKSGAERIAILGYFEDGPNLVTMAMNGWGDPEPKWWLNLQAQPEVTVDLKSGPRAVRARAAQGEERTRLWAKWAEYDGEALDSWASRRSRQTQVVILEPRSESAGTS